MGLRGRQPSIENKLKGLTIDLETCKSIIDLNNQHSEETTGTDRLPLL